MTPERLAAIINHARITSADLKALAADESWRTAERLGIMELVADRLANNPALNEGLSARIKAIASRQIALDNVHTAELRRCLAALAAAGVECVLMKGAQLAYTHYRRSDLRPRFDADIMIPVARREAAQNALASEGYLPDIQSSADLMLHQKSYVKPLDNRTAHVVDLHWRVTNPEIFRGILTFEEIAASAVPVAALGSSARGLSAIHALLLACVARVAHPHSVERLIWLYDIHLIASRLDPREWSLFASLAADRGVAAICANGLGKARGFFRTPVPVNLRGSARPAAKARIEATAIADDKPPAVRVVAATLTKLARSYR